MKRNNETITKYPPHASTICTPSSSSSSSLGRFGLAGGLVQVAECASWGPSQLMHSGDECAQRQPRVAQVAVGQVWSPVECCFAHQRQVARLVHFSVWCPN